MRNASVAGTYANLIAKRFALASKRCGLDDHRAAPLDTSRFWPPVVPPPAPAPRGEHRDDRQLDLF